MKNLSNNSAFDNIKIITFLKILLLKLLNLKTKLSQSFSTTFYHSAQLWHTLTLYLHLARHTLHPVTRSHRNNDHRDNNSFIVNASTVTDTMTLDLWHELLKGKEGNWIQYWIHLCIATEWKLLKVNEATAHKIHNKHVRDKGVKLLSYGKQWFWWVVEWTTEMYYLCGSGSYG